MKDRNRDSMIPAGRVPNPKTAAADISRRGG